MLKRGDKREGMGGGGRGGEGDGGRRGERMSGGQKKGEGRGKGAFRSFFSSTTLLPQMH